MNLHDKYCLERETDPSRAEDPELAAVINENAAFDELSAIGPDEPRMPEMLAAAYAQAAGDEEQPKMNPFSMLFSSKRWYARAAIAATLVVVTALAFTLTPVRNPAPDNNSIALAPATPAFAAQPGYLMAYNMGEAKEEEARAKAEELEEEILKILAGKEAELQVIQQRLAGTFAELAESKRVLDLKLGGTELNDQEAALIEALEQQEAAAEKLNEFGGDYLQYMADALAYKTDALNAYSEQINLSLKALPEIAVSNLETTFEEQEDGTIKILIAIPGLPAVTIEEIKKQLAEIQESDDLVMEYVTIIESKEGENTFTVKLSDVEGEYHVVTGLDDLEGAYYLANEPDDVEHFVFSIVGTSEDGASAKIDVDVVGEVTVVKIRDEEGAKVIRPSISIDGNIDLGLYSVPSTFAFTITEDGEDVRVFGSTTTGGGESGARTFTVLRGNCDKDGSGEEVSITAEIEGGTITTEIDGETITIEKDGEIIVDGEIISPELLKDLESHGIAIISEGGDNEHISITTDFLSLEELEELKSISEIDLEEITKNIKVMINGEAFSLEDLAKEDFLEKLGMLGLGEDFDLSDDSHALYLKDFEGLYELKDLEKLKELGVWKDLEELKELGKLKELQEWKEVEGLENLEGFYHLEKLDEVLQNLDGVLNTIILSTGDDIELVAIGEYEKQLEEFSEGIAKFDTAEQYYSVQLDDFGSEVVSIVELGSETVVAGDLEAYKPELKAIRDYIAKHYPDQEAGFAAAGESGEMEVEIIIDGETVEKFTTGRDENGNVIITHNT